MDIEKYIDSDLLDRFEFYNYGHALEILHDAFPVEWDELQECLRKLKLTLADIKKAGGMEELRGFCLQEKETTEWKYITTGTITW